MKAKEQVRLLIGDLPFHLRNTVTIGTGQVTELRLVAAAEIDRLRAALDSIETATATGDGLSPDEIIRVHQIAHVALAGGDQK